MWHLHSQGAGRGEAEEGACGGPYHQEGFGYLAEGTYQEEFGYLAEGFELWPGIWEIIKAKDGQD